MTSKGAQYSKVFRKAGIAWGKGNLDAAIEDIEKAIFYGSTRTKKGP